MNKEMKKKNSQPSLKGGTLLMVKEPFIRFLFVIGLLR